jgi:hypothetical protein
MATEHLISQGARRIAHIRGPSVSTGAGRLRLYRKALVLIPPRLVIRDSSRRRPLADARGSVSVGH